MFPFSFVFNIFNSLQNKMQNKIKVKKPEYLACCTDIILIKLVKTVVRNSPAGMQSNVFTFKKRREEKHNCLKCLI